MTARLRPSAALNVKLALATGPLNAALDRLWRPEGLADRYGAYLLAMHSVIRASVPLMKHAAGRCTLLADQLAGPLSAYLERHIEEERGHDDWVLSDLAAAGLDPLEAYRRLPPPDVAALVGPQYYWVEHFHPVALLGYIAVLEGHSPAPWLAARLAAATGLPDRAFRTLRYHAELDTDHRSELDELLDRLPLDQAQASAIGVSALHTVHAATELFTRLGRTPGTKASSRERTYRT